MLVRSTERKIQNNKEQSIINLPKHFLGWLGWCKGDVVEVRLNEEAKTIELHNEARRKEKEQLLKEQAYRNEIEEKKYELERLQQKNEHLSDIEHNIGIAKAEEERRRENILEDTW